MNNESMYMNVENMKTIVNSFKGKINALNEVYKDIELKNKEIDGSCDTWKGDNQKKFQQFFSQTINKYPKNIDKLNEFYSFLVKTIENYEERDQDINRDIDSKDEFDV